MPGAPGAGSGAPLQSPNRPPRATRSPNGRARCPGRVLPGAPAPRPRRTVTQGPQTHPSHANLGCAGGPGAGCGLKTAVPAADPSRRPPLLARPSPGRPSTPIEASSGSLLTPSLRLLKPRWSQVTSPQGPPTTCGRALRPAHLLGVEIPGPVPVPAVLRVTAMRHSGPMRCPPPLHSRSPTPAAARPVPAPARNRGAAARAARRKRPSRPPRVRPPRARPLPRR